MLNGVLLSGINFKVERGDRDTVMVDRVPKCLHKRVKEDGVCPELEEAVTDLLKDHAEVGKCVTQSCF
jgi:hypothetical protein